MARPRVAFFDWHGTLVDTFEAMYRAVDDMLALLEPLGIARRLVRPGSSALLEHELLIAYVRVHRRLPGWLKGARRISRTEIFEILFGRDEYAKHVAHEAFDRRYMQHFGTVRPFEPGVRAMLVALRAAGVATGLLSNRRRALLMQELAKVDGTGWKDLFDVVVCGDDVRRRKPAPDMVMRALAGLRTTPGTDSWFVGDSTTDIAAAKAAGVSAIYYNGAKWEPGRLARMFPDAYRPDAIAGNFAALRALALQR
jgi:phosphoglycolate phosphatase